MNDKRSLVAQAANTAVQESDDLFHILNAQLDGYGSKGWQRIRRNLLRSKSHRADVLIRELEEHFILVPREDA